MRSNKQPIITEDGQRLTIDNGQITGTEDPNPGLAFETGNVFDEKNEQEGGGACPTPANKRGGNSNTSEAMPESNNE